MPADLFNEKTVERLSKKVKPSKEQQVIAHFWQDEYDQDNLEHEKQTYPLFVAKILGGILGYPIEKVPQEKYGADFSYEGQEKEKLVLFEVKGSKSDLFDKQYGRKVRHGTPILQLADYLMKHEFKYGIATNYHEFVLIDRSKSYEIFYYFDFKTIKKNPEKLKEFIGVFSRESIESGFVEKIKQESETEEREFTKQFYKLYHETRLMLIKEFEESSQNRADAIHYAQVFLNRFMFINFAEDTGKLPRRLLEERILEMLSNKNLINDHTNYVCDVIKNLFSELNTGTNTPIKLFGFNGGLFCEYIKPEYTFKDLRKPAYFKELHQQSTLKKTKQSDLVESQILSKIQKEVNQIVKNILLMASYDFTTEVNVDILGHIFEQSLSDLEEIQEGEVSKRKKEGVYYTPEYITDYICRNTIIPYLTEKESKTVEELIKEYSGRLDILENKLSKLKILDPACGSGAFLIKAVDVLMEIHDGIREERHKTGKYQTVTYGKGGKVKAVYGDFMAEEEDIDKAREIIDHNIYGVDLNEESVEITKLSLFLKIARGHKKLLDLNEKILCGNSLIDDPEIAGKKAFKWEERYYEIFRDGGFDIVIGNPPYTYRKAISESEKKFFKNSYLSTEGNFDLYKFFMEKTTHLLKNGGVASLIVPNTFLTAKTYQKLRQIFIDEYSILELFDLGQDIFEGVIVENIIFLVKKTQKKSNKTLIKVQRDRNRDFNNLEKKHTINLSELQPDNNSFTIYISNQIRPLISKMQNNSELLGDICYATVGINTGYIKNELTAPTKIDNRYHKMLNGKDIGRNQVEWPGEWILYDSKVVKSYGDKGRSLPPEYIFTKPKILVQRTRRGMKRKLVCYYDEDKYYNLNRISNILLTSDKFELKYIYVLVNSSLMDFYFNYVFNEYEVKPLHLSKLPIKKISLKEQKIFTQKADLILSFNIKLLRAKNSFIERLNSKFSIKSSSGKLNNLWMLKYDDFKKEVCRVTKIRFKTSLEERKFDEYWSGDFEETKKELLGLKQKIDQTDREIDQIVYKLYDLTEEEIKIVEDVVK